MPFTFECGVCHASYRLDEHQITATAVKITCPRCLNYFFLKRGGLENAERPVVEFVVQDGAHDVSSKVAPYNPPPKTPPHATPPAPPLPQKKVEESSADSIETQLDSVFMSINDKTDPVRPVPEKRKEPVTKITAADLSDLPPDPPPPGALDQYVILGSSILIVGVALLYMNYERILGIPGMGKWQKPLPAAQPTVQITPEAQKTPKYGFPQMNTEYDPWSNKPLKTPPAGSEGAKEK